MTVSSAPDPMLPEPLRIARAKRETHGVFTFELDVSARGGFPFLPGQFNMLYPFGAGESAISISSDPHQPDRLEHTIRAVGAVTRAIERLGRGDVVGVRGPFGSAWPIREAEGRDLVVIAGGIGLAPLRPVVYHALRRREAFGKVALLYGTRTPDDILYRKEIERWRGRLDVEVEVTVDTAGSDWRGNTGVVTKLISRAAFDPGRAFAMICGPEIMMRFCARELERLGVSLDRIWITMERNMRCGTGLCGHCQFGPSFVCKDGPVYRYDRVQDLLLVREV
ncbi:FAD/NAD(P)-binding protein [Polyangium fumosum]|uniref:Ni/Fe hydrogenase subunit gamma n=1 Tax=Polyangium fumosum TaxID=889272 RepID=A0A4U1J7I1_9BACT|nr:FAD/NAD(P)-binding protein [Polyangium fumosum]TKD03332.1 Ni/Fe hydrogenase subunit gamma [Polyangium fumosum]